MDADSRRGIHSMAHGRAVYRSIAFRDGQTGSTVWITPGARIISQPALTLLPAFIDTHNHLPEATRNRALVPVQNAHSLEEFTDLIRNRAMATPKGRWIQTSILMRGMSRT
jgi:predicted amidohydrolase YtcJ